MKLKNQPYAPKWEQEEEIEKKNIYTGYKTLIMMMMMTIFILFDILIFLVSLHKEHSIL
jgi:hypothetical protein